MVARKVSVGCGAAMLDHPAVVGMCACYLVLEVSYVNLLLFYRSAYHPILVLFVPKNPSISRGIVSLNMVSLAVAIYAVFVLLAGKIERAGISENLNRLSISSASSFYFVREILFPNVLLVSYYICLPTSVTFFPRDTSKLGGSALTLWKLTTSFRYLPTLLLCPHGSSESGYNLFPFLFGVTIPFPDSRLRKSFPYFWRSLFTYFTLTNLISCLLGYLTAKTRKREFSERLRSFFVSPFSTISTRSSISEFWVSGKISVISYPSPFGFLPHRLFYFLKKYEFRFFTNSQKTFNPVILPRRRSKRTRIEMKESPTLRFVCLTDVTHKICNWVNQRIDKSGTIFLRLGPLLQQVAHRFTSGERGGAAPFISFNSIRLEVA